MDGGRKARRRGRGRGWLALGGIVVLLLIGAGILWHNRRTVLVSVASHVAATLQPKNVKVVHVQAQQPFSILVMGTEGAPQLTDTMLVLTYEPATQSVSIMSVPRDLWITLPKYGPHRINAAYEDGGPQVAELMVEKYVGVPIEYWALVNYQALVDLVNAVGGVNVVVPPGVTGKGIVDHCYPNANNTACTTFILPVGPQHLNGVEALKFSRERHSFADGDIQRQRDQQEVMLGLRDALLHPQNLFHLTRIVRDLTSMVQTNVPYADIPALAAAVLRVPKTKIQTGVLDYSSGAVRNYVTSGGAYVLLENASVVRRIVSQTCAGILADMRPYSVQVEAATQQEAAHYTAVLQNMGITTRTPTATPQPQSGNAVYLNTAVLHPSAGAGTPAEAYILGRMLGTKVQPAPVPASHAQIVVVLGAGFPTF